MVHAPATQEPDWGRRGGLLGGVIGCCGASIGFIAVSIYLREFRVLWQLGVPFFAQSLGIGLMIAIAMDGVCRILGTRGMVFHSAVLGCILTVMGLLLLVSRRWLEPAIRGIVAFKPYMHGPFGPSDSAISLMMSIGAILLFFVFVRMFLAPGETPDHAGAGRGQCETSIQTNRAQAVR